MGPSPSKSVATPLFRLLWSARPYEESIEDYTKRVVEFIKSNPEFKDHLDKEIRWKAFNCKREELKHWFMVLQPVSIPNANYFAIELNINEQSNTVSMNFGVILPGMFQSLENLGEINVSVAQIFGTAYDIMKEMGQYNLIYNNCQDFVKMLASNLQAPGEVTPVIEGELHTVHVHVQTI